MSHDDPTEIATAFTRAWERAWNEGGPAATARLYTADAVLVGAAMGIGQREIERLLGLLHKQGWTTVAIKVVNARAASGVVLAACEFTAQGSGANAGKELRGKSSHVLVRAGDAWLSTMHSAA